MQRCLMLDVDGVLVKGRPEDGLSWASDIERDLGIDPKALAGEFFAPHWDDIVTGRAGLLDVLGACLPSLADGVSAEAFADYWFARDARVDEAVLAECDALRAAGMRVVLATNQEHLRADYLMERLGLGEHVDGIVYSAAVGARKPDAAFFAAAVERCGVAAGACLLVDDTAANIAAARRAGWQAALWSEGASLTRLVAEPAGGG